MSESNNGLSNKFPRINPLLWAVAKFIKRYETALEHQLDCLYECQDQDGIYETQGKIAAIRQVRSFLSEVDSNPEIAEMEQDKLDKALNGGKRKSRDTNPPSDRLLL